jgi:TRAP-type mannitol/chloroaromatic compound transport system substrate-binding protein
MGGWARRRLRDVGDVEGMKVRLSGLAGKIMQRLGAVPVAVARQDLAKAFRDGRLDMASWVAPVDDEALDLAGVAPWYYYPGWFQGGMAAHLVINLKAWTDLPPPWQAALRAACDVVHLFILARYDAENMAALKRLVARGVTLTSFPDDMTGALWRATNAVFEDMAAKNEGFRRARDMSTSFRDDQYLWWQVAEYSYDNMLIRQRAKP